MQARPHLLLQTGRACVQGDVAVEEVCFLRRAGTDIRTSWTHSPGDNMVEDSQIEFPETIMSGKSEYKGSHVHLFWAKSQGSYIFTN